MRIIANSAGALTAILVCVLTACPGEAQPARVFVGAHGSDGNPCTFAPPCRSLQKAHDTVAAAGELDVLAPAGYGALTITRAISIEGHGFAGITAGSGATAITINTGGGAAAGVNLRGLLIDGVGAGATGIVNNSALTYVHIKIGRAHV